MGNVGGGPRVGEWRKSGVGGFGGGGICPGMFAMLRWRADRSVLTSRACWRLLMSSALLLGASCLRCRSHYPLTSPVRARQLPPPLSTPLFMFRDTGAEEGPAPEVDLPEEGSENET